MLFGKNKQKDYTQDLDEIKREVSVQAEKIETLLNGRMDEVQKMQKRQTQSLEDFLEEEDERAEIVEAWKERAQETEEREAHLLSLAGCYQEQLHLLRKQIMAEFQGDEYKAAAWEKQFAIVDDCLRKEMRPCAMEQTGTEKEMLDFMCHQVLQVIETEDEELDNRVAEVFSPGCIYQGKVIKKAQVAAYRRIKDGDSNRN